MGALSGRASSVPSKTTAKAQWISAVEGPQEGRPQLLKPLRGAVKPGA